MPDAENLAPLEASRFARLMSRTCEVCKGLSSSAAGASDAAKDAPPRLRRHLIGSRIVALCAAHSHLVRAAGVTSLDELAHLFPELGGRRSLLGRRSPLDRRIFPARPEGRRRSDGRRGSERQSA